MANKLAFPETVGLLTDDCRGQSYDNASNMFGKYQGMLTVFTNSCVKSLKRTPILGMPLTPKVVKATLSRIDPVDRINATHIAKCLGLDPK